MGNSEAREKLRKEAEDKPEKPEWTFKVFRNPPGLSVDHFGDMRNFSKDELEEIVTGSKLIRFYDKNEKKWKMKHEPFDFGRFTWLPKNMYRAFMMNACDALGIVYRAYMIERVTPEVQQKAVIVFPPKMEWQKHAERAESLKVRYRIIGDEIKAMEEFFRMAKKK